MESTFYQRRSGRVLRLFITTVLAGALVAGLESDPADALAAGWVSLVSHAAAGPTVAGNQPSPEDTPGMSADGAYVAFASAATDLVAGQTDTNGWPDVFLYERATGAVTLVSHAAGSPTTAANHVSARPSISADGRYVAYQSFAGDLVAGQNKVQPFFDLFLYDRITGINTLVSHVPGSTTTAGDHQSFSPIISADGAYVVFTSQAANLVGGQSDPNDNPSSSVWLEDVFLYDRITGSVTLVSHTADDPTATANAASFGQSISGDGRFVVVSSAATNLVPGQNDANGQSDVFLYARLMGGMTLVSHVPGSATTTANDASAGGRIGVRNDFVAFESRATNLVGGQTDANGGSDVFLYNHFNAEVRLVSHAVGTPTTTANGTSGAPVIDNDGSSVAFESTATNLVAGQEDFNNARDVFLFDRLPATNVLVSADGYWSSPPRTANGGGYAPTISGDGHLVVFLSHATNLSPYAFGNGSTQDVYLFDRSLADQAHLRVTLVSHRAAAPHAEANASSCCATISADGGFVAFLSAATDLVTAQSDVNGGNDVFSFSRLATPARPPADFNGDDRTDVSVYRPPAGIWFSSGGPTVAWGTAGDIPVPGDYDGDGTTDRAVYRPSVGWFIKHSSGTDAFVNWGTSDSIPVPADYDGDDKTDVAVYRLHESFGAWFGTWSIQLSTGGSLQESLGTSGDIPVPADYNGDGRADRTVFRPSTGLWASWAAGFVTYGTNGDIPVPGDYDLDGRTDRAVFRPSIGVWFVQESTGGETVRAYGTNGDIPVPGDYDGDGDSDIAVFRPSGGYWFVDGGTTTQFGTSGDVPLPLPDAIRRFFFPPL